MSRDNDRRVGISSMDENKRKRDLGPHRRDMCVRGVKVSVRRAFHAWCDLRGILMRDQLEYLMEQCVKGEDL
jgi:hypothetical protein